MTTQIATYEYPVNFEKYWTDERDQNNIDLQSDLEIISKFIVELNSISDNYNNYVTVDPDNYVTVDPVD